MARRIFALLLLGALGGACGADPTAGGIPVGNPAEQSGCLKLRMLGQVLALPGAGPHISLDCSLRSLEEAAEFDQVDCRIGEIGDFDEFVELDSVTLYTSSVSADGSLLRLEGIGFGSLMGIASGAVEWELELIRDQNTLDYAGAGSGFWGGALLEVTGTASWHPRKDDPEDLRCLAQTDVESPSSRLAGADGAGRSTIKPSVS